MMQKDPGTTNGNSAKVPAKMPAETVDKNLPQRKGNSKLQQFLRDHHINNNAASTENSEKFKIKNDHKLDDSSTISLTIECKCSI
ncbi:6243_t:CDS:2 [Funneliformis caledonium]|uniref:6243_t:CDS:1 n=1 Tax=Funneliformis caledonium TaxID=1117310 RepID=A0A9N8V4N3_9GLOM|nr:6243_t:CDS:2 [Funneliformis caledonium]